MFASVWRTLLWSRKSQQVPGTARNTSMNLCQPSAHATYSVVLQWLQKRQRQAFSADQRFNQSRFFFQIANQRHVPILLAVPFWWTQVIDWIQFFYSARASVPVWLRSWVHATSALLNILASRNTLCSPSLADRWDRIGFFWQKFGVSMADRWTEERSSAHLSEYLRWKFWSQLLIKTKVSKCSGKFSQIDQYHAFKVKGRSEKLFAFKFYKKY